MSEPFISEIKLWPGNYEPRGWAFCDGRTMSIMDNQALYSLLGNAYGGDGRTTFALPDLRGRVPIGEGIGPGLTRRYLGSRGGTETVPLVVGNLPEHTHIANVKNVHTTNNLDVDATIRCLAGGSRNKQTSPQNGILMQSQVPDNAFYTTDDPDSSLSDNAVETTMTGDVNVTLTIENQNTGQNYPHENVQPFQTLNFIIALEGVYPSRS